MREGDEGADDEWIAIYNTWFDSTGAEFKSNETWNAFIEEEPAARFRMWFDTWVNKKDSSQQIGSRTTAYYTGMHRQSGGWLSWELVGGSPWVPFMRNESEAMAFAPTRQADGDPMPMSMSDMMYFSLTLQKIDLGSPDWEDIRICIEDMNIEEFRLQARNQLMEGVNTPIFEDSKVPDMPQTGILSPIYDAIGGFLEMLWKDITSVLQLGWNALASQVPWFTDFWEATAILVGDGYQFVIYVIEQLAALLTWGLSFISYLAYPIEVITGAYDNLVEMTSNFVGVDPQSATVLLIIVFAILPLTEAIERGDRSYVVQFLGAVWSVANTLFTVIINAIRFTVNFIMEFWPL
jgi:hypothetical protein